MRPFHKVAELEGEMRMFYAFFAVTYYLLISCKHPNI